MNKYLILNMVKSFFRHKSGSVTIEFFFMLLFLLAIFAFMADLIMIRSTLGKLDNASNTMANILATRTKLYQRKTEITADDVVQMRALAKYILYGDKNINKQVYVVLEHLVMPTGSANEVTTVGDEALCKPINPIGTLENLSPRSELRGERKIPLYQVTLCVETSSLFKSWLLDEASNNSKNSIRSSTMTISR